MKRLTRSFTLVLTLTGLLAAGLAGADDYPAGVVDIPHTKFVLDNGLTLIVHEDHKAPIVAVNVWYDVGSADEKPGKTGFAHLFEHLMFNGSENYNDDYFKPFDRVGATGMNGTTNFDRTNYFQEVPKTALDMALWMESDRMGHLLGAIDQARLDEQRGVVQNEKRQGENQPYGKAFLTIFENTVPSGHPYDHSVIGSLEDLDAASLDDVKNWFRAYYGTANAVLVVAGDVEAADVKERVERYFGDIEPGPPLTKPAINVEPLRVDTRSTMSDRVPQARIYKAWNVAEWGNPDVDSLDLLAQILANGKSSRLYKRLVYDDQIATDVTAFNWTRELGGLFVMFATAQPGGDLAAVEKAMDEELARLLDEGPTAAEVERAQVGLQSGFVRGLERIGGFGGKSDILATYQVYFGDADAHRHSQANVLSATPAAILEAGRRWLNHGSFALEVNPFPDFKAQESSLDRSTGVPAVDSFPAGKFPTRESATLANGMKVIVAERNSVPIVNMQLLLDAGYASDQFGLPGTANLALKMLDEGTTSRSALEISDTLEKLGANLNAGSDLDASVVTMSALTENLEPSLDLLADVVLNPSFPQSEFERLRRQQIAGIQSEMVQPLSMALRVFPKLLYGEGHAYGLPMTGSGTIQSVEAMTTEALAKFHSTWFRPNNATLVVVGDVAMADVLPMLEKRFGTWQAGDIPTKNLATVEQQPESAVYLVDRPNSEQSIIFAGFVAPPKGSDHALQIDAMNSILGGGFTGRINLNLREDKHWSYGARSFIQDAVGQRPFIAYAPVQTDKTSESMAEILSEIRGIRSGGTRPATAEELAKIKDQKTLTLPGRWETNNAVLND
ncbi:MAG: insulinase family protein, partial [Thermoanaerobaculia bacterium]|nr:insulinase family protein [Thermoanaerobaculia bacterium]